MKLKIINETLTFIIIICVSVCYRAIGIPKSNHTFEDVALIRECKRLELPHETGLVEFGQTARPYR